MALVVHPPIEETGYNLPTSIEERDIGRASRAFSRLGFFFFFFFERTADDDRERAIRG